MMPNAMHLEQLRILLVDEATVSRKALRSLLEQLENVDVAGTAATDAIALSKINDVRPHLLVVSLNSDDVLAERLLGRLPREDIAVLLLAMERHQDRAVALSMTASNVIDIVTLPDNLEKPDAFNLLKRNLKHPLAAYIRAKSVRDILTQAPTTISAPKLIASAAVDRTISRVGPDVAVGLPEVVAIGISTGGPRALNIMLPQLTRLMERPVVIVQHMPPAFTLSLAQELNKKCAYTVVEAQVGQRLEPRHAYIAPGGKQMKVYRQSEAVVIDIADDPPENSCKPSVDYLFRSVAAVYGAKCLGVIMTGMGSDGLKGCRVIKQCGGWIITQDQATCTVYGMPRQPAEEGLSDMVVPLGRIAESIAQLVRQR